MLKPLTNLRMAKQTKFQQMHGTFSSSRMVELLSSDNAGVRQSGKYNERSSVDLIHIIVLYLVVDLYWTVFF